jgi:hypothetical protein
MFLPSREADLAIAENQARQQLDEAYRAGDYRMARQRTVALWLAEKARREG